MAFDKNFRIGEKLPIFWPWRVFVLSLIVFIFSILIYLGMELGMKNYYSKEITRVKSNIDQLAASLSDEEREALLNMYSQFVNIEKIFKNQKENVYLLFDFIEKNTHPEVNYQDFSFDKINKEIRLSGTSLNYQFLVSEIKSFEENKAVKKVISDNVKLRKDGTIQFSLKIDLKDNFFELLEQDSFQPEKEIKESLETESEVIDQEVINQNEIIQNN